MCILFKLDMWWYVRVNLEAAKYRLTFALRRAKCIRKSIARISCRHKPLTINGEWSLRQKESLKSFTTGGNNWLVTVEFYNIANLDFTFSTNWFLGKLSFDIYSFYNLHHFKILLLLSISNILQHFPHFLFIFWMFLAANQTYRKTFNSV